MNTNTKTILRWLRADAKDCRIYELPEIAAHIEQAAEWLEFLAERMELVTHADDGGTARRVATAALKGVRSEQPRASAPRSEPQSPRLPGEKPL